MIWWLVISHSMGGMIQMDARKVTGSVAVCAEAGKAGVGVKLAEGRQASYGCYRFQ